GFLQILARFDHILQVPRGQPHTPRICERVPGFGAERQQRCMRKRDHFFLLFLAFGPKHKLDVHGVRMTDRDASLKPPELHLPGSSERIRTSFKTAGVFEHRLQRSKASMPPSAAASGTLPWAS